MIRLERISLGLEVVLVSSARMENRWALMSIYIFSRNSMRKMALTLLMVVIFLTGYRLNTMM